MKITKPYNSTQKLSSSLLGIEEASTQTSTIILDKEEELCIIEVISDSRFPVLLVYSALEKSYSIMKCFPFEANKISLYYKNESRFAGIQHPNIISNWLMTSSQTFNKAFNRLTPKLWRPPLRLSTRPSKMTNCFYAIFQSRENAQFNLPILSYW